MTVTSSHTQTHIVKHTQGTNNKQTTKIHSNEIIQFLPSTLSSSSSSSSSTSSRTWTWTAASPYPRLMLLFVCLLLLASVCVLTSFHGDGKFNIQNTQKHTRHAHSTTKSSSSSSHSSSSSSSSASSSSPVILSSYDASFRSCLLSVLDSYLPSDTGVTPPLHSATPSLFHFPLFRTDAVYRHACSPRFDVSALGVPLRPSGANAFMSHIPALTQQVLPNDYDHAYIPTHIDPAALLNTRHAWSNSLLFAQHGVDVVSVTGGAASTYAYTDASAPQSAAVDEIWKDIQHAQQLVEAPPHPWSNMYDILMAQYKFSPELYSQLVDIGYWYALSSYAPALVEQWCQYSTQLKTIVDRLKALPTHPADLFRRVEVVVGADVPLFTASLPACTSRFLRARTLSRSFFQELDPANPDALPQQWFNQLQHIWMIVPPQLTIAVPLRQAHADAYKPASASPQPDAGAGSAEEKAWQTRFGFRECKLPTASPTFCLKCLIGKKILFRGDSVTRYQFIELAWFLHFGEHIPQNFVEQVGDPPNPVNEFSFPSNKPSPSDTTPLGDTGPRGAVYAYRWRHFFYFFSYMFGDSFQLRDVAVAESGSAPTWIKCQTLLYTHPLLDIEVAFSFQAGLKQANTPSLDQFFTHQLSKELSLFHPRSSEEEARRVRVKSYSATWLSRRSHERAMYTSSVDSIFSSPPTAFPSPSSTPGPLPEGLTVQSREDLAHAAQQQKASYLLAQRLLHDFTGASIKQTHIESSTSFTFSPDSSASIQNTSSSSSPSASPSPSKLDSAPLPAPPPLTVAPYDCSLTWCPDIMISNFGIWKNLRAQSLAAHADFLSSLEKILPNMFYIWKSTSLTKETDLNALTLSDNLLIAKQIYQHRHRAAYLDMRRIAGAYTPPEFDGLFLESVPFPGWDRYHFHAHVLTAVNNVLIAYMCDQQANFILNVTSREENFKLESQETF